jgi:glycosyltransferase involved in cell wall biosynthesis
MSKITKLFLVDPVCHSRAPTMRAWLQAAAEILPKHFKEVEIWSMECELEAPWLTWRKIPRVSRFMPVQFLFFRCIVWFLFWRLPKGERDRSFLQCTGEHLPYADSRYIHFWNICFSEIAKKKPAEMCVKWRDRLFRHFAVLGERQALKPNATGEWWCVSRGIAAPIKESAPSDSHFCYLPNSYDPKRFNHGVREAARSEARSHYGIAEHEFVLVFCSFGHFVRKGLMQAVQTVNRLSKLGYPVRLLVFGGTERAVSEFQALMKSEGESQDSTHFAGLVSPPEWHLSAGDALFFPSHFEAFSLVEIEAAALGLRLYLTAHPGSEMILKEGVNGRLLPWDVEGMVKILTDEMESGAIRQTHDELGEALSPPEYALALSQLYANAIERKERVAFTRSN